MIVFILTLSLACPHGSKDDVHPSPESNDITRIAHDDVSSFAFKPFEGSTPSLWERKVEKLVRRWGQAASDLEADAYVSRSKGIILFSVNSEEDARWMHSLIDRTLEAFRYRFGLDGTARKPIAVFQFVADGKYDQFVDRLVAEEAYLTNWAPTAKTLNGFAIYRPEVVAIEANEMAQKGVNLENNLVHLVGHLALSQSFGVQPFWIREGVALDLEVTVLDKLYAFCSHGEFDPGRRPGAWRKEVKGAWKRHRSINVESMVELSQGALTRSASLRTLGVARYLMKEQREEFSAFLDIMRADREQQLRHSQQYVPDFEFQVSKMDATLKKGWRDAALEHLKEGESKEEIEEEAKLKATHSDGQADKKSKKDSKKSRKKRSRRR